MKKITFILILLSSFAIHAQRTCNTDQIMSQIMSNPEQRAVYLKQQQKFEIELAKLESHSTTSAKNVSNTIRIPVAVHFPSAGSASATLKTCLRNLAQNQINVLNADFNASNADISEWVNVSEYYPSVTNLGNLNVQFVLATQNHPGGYGLLTGEPAITFGYNFAAGVPSSQPMYDANWAGYLNFVVKNIGSGLLGYAPLGGNPTSGHAVAINTFCFGATGGTNCTGYIPNSPYNLGRTTTHELGHYFNLDHTFTSCGNPSSCSSTGDKVCDTPASNAPVYGCPVPASMNGCLSTEYKLTMNFMDYTDDACMYMYTQGQEQRMRAWYNSIASQFNSTTLSNIDLLKNNYSIHPNPNKGEFIMTFKDLLNDYSVEVFDVTGRVVYDRNFSQNSDLTQTISISDPKTGIYFVNVKSGSTISTEKIIVK